MTADDLAKEYYKLGVYTGVRAGEKRTYVFVSGLKKNFPKAFSLFIKNIKDAQANTESFKKYIESLKKERANNKLSKWYIGYNERNYAKYGKDNPQRYTLTNDELDKLDSEKMVNLINHILDYKHYILYYGPEKYETAKEMVKNTYSPAKNLQEIPEAVKFKELDNGGKVYFTNYDMVQSSVTLMSKDRKFNPEIMPYTIMFNTFYGAGLSSIVFQELRESKGLVYSAYAYLYTPEEKEGFHYLTASLNTQPDKMKDALEAMFGILNKMPDAKAQFEESRKAALIKIESRRLTKADPFWVYKGYQKLGIDYDIYEMMYKKIQNMTYDDFQDFFKEHITNKKFDIVVMGKEEDINFEVLNNYGEIIKLSLDDLFVY